MAANGDEAAIKAGIKMVANAWDSAKVSDEQAAKLVSELMIESVKKNPKSWSGLQKFAKVTLGVSAAGLATYGAYKLLTKENVAVAAPTTTTESA
ncbi:RxLR effector protein [Phytophthora megakarya]|uniref:RxLR effector protein n=1 Tax=Phytophthora megakarya TaxID=4795 RepID=A0A225VE45_9STRA|nr:RxLR effector protein [Phytophthora megakarya]